MDFTSLIEAAHKGDAKARDTLVEENLGLVWNIVRHFYGRGCEPEDLFQIGSMGLIKAIDKFDTSLGLQFSTYAVPLITGEIKRFLRDDGMVKVSRSLKENGWKVSKVRQELFKELGREPTISEISAAAGLSSEEIFMAVEANKRVESIHQSFYQGDGSEVLLEDRLCDEHDENERVINHLLVEELLSSLKEDERRLISMRYFEDCTQSEAAIKLGISQVQVSRLEKKILRHLRNVSGC